MNHALETLREARDHARHALAQHEDAIARLKAADLDEHSAALAVRADADCGHVMPAAAFAFGIGQKVTLNLSREQGMVIGYAAYQRQPPQYLVEYVSGDGRQVENWFFAEALEATSNHHAA